MMKKILVINTVILSILLAACSVPLEGPGVKPFAPSAPVLTAGSGSLQVSWKKDAVAESYNLYYGTTPAPPASPAQAGINGTSATITNLVNDTPYYVWVQAVNARGGSPMGAWAQKTLTLEAPETVSLTPEDGALTVSWGASDLADSYNVYCHTAGTPPADPARTGIAGTTTTVTGLSNGTDYYVWVQAVNAGGVSPLSAAESVKLPIRFSAGTAAEFSAAISGINEGGSNTYLITITGNFSGGPVTFTAGTSKTITIKGDALPRTISNSGSAALFTVPNNITLALDDNIILNGNAKSYSGVRVDGGALIMKAGSTVSNAYANGVYINNGNFTMEGGTIIGNTASYSSYGGVYVSSGSFTMSGGTISGNTGGGVYVSSGSFTMSGGTISGNTARSFSSYSYSYGGGVYVGGTFTMEGGTISGNIASPYSYGGGVCVGSGGSFVKNGGGTIDANNSASYGNVAYISSGNKKRDAEAGPGDNLNSALPGSAGGWE
ncbi:MAG: fibronectin type III domain-containing protein [Treponema sp.]|jgi:hypothetical protein|nr:fibronectin type III domain-containing protein [Treponema sp.]